MISSREVTTKYCFCIENTQIFVRSVFYTAHKFYVWSMLHVWEPKSN